MVSYDTWSELNGKTETVTAALLNKLIEWSSSRYNDCKKSDVVRNLMFLVERGTDCYKEYRSGCYSERAHMGKFRCNWSGGSYSLTIKDGVAELSNCTHDVISSEPFHIRLDKPRKNKYFIPARRVLYTESRYGIQSGEYEVIGQSYCAFFVEVDGVERHIDKAYCRVIE